MRLVELVLIVSLLSNVCCNQENDEKDDPFGNADTRVTDKKDEIVRGPSDKFHGGFGDRSAKPNVELPPHVVADDGALSLFADYKNPEKSGIPLYLVNRTGREIRFLTQDGDLYLRLEYSNKDGNWIRAQVYRASSCGNSYGSVSLLPGNFIKRSGYFPKKGKAMTVRYRSVENELVSNAGPGFFLDLDREAAELDDNARNEIPGALAEILIFDPGMRREPISDEDYLFALQLLSEFSESEFYRNQARRKIAASENSAPIVPKIREILDRPWPKPQNENGGILLNLCLDRIEQKDYSSIAWETIIGMLKDLAKNRYSLSRDHKIRISAVFSDTLKNKNEEEISKASGLIEIRSYASEYISDDQILELLNYKNKFLCIRAIKMMASRGRFESVGPQAMAMDRKSQFQILQYLAREDTSSRYGMPVYHLPSGKIEREFWEMLFDKDPVKAVRSMPYFSGNRNPYTQVAYAPLKKFLEKEIKTMGDEPRKVEDLYALSGVVQFFGNFQKKSDISLLKSLLSHPGYEVQRVYRIKGTIVGKRNFRVRKAARDALFSMLVSVGPAINFEDETPVELKEND